MTSVRLGKDHFGLPLKEGWQSYRLATKCIPSISGYSVGVMDKFSKLLGCLFYRERILGVWMKATNSSFPVSMPFRRIIRILRFGQYKLINLEDKISNVEK
jgi:hypothetical protein